MYSRGGPPVPAGYGLPASARAEPEFRVGCALPVEVGGEQRFVVSRPRDAGGAELGARVLDGVVGELRASGLGADEDLGASRLLPLAQTRRLLHRR